MLWASYKKKKKKVFPLFSFSTAEPEEMRLWPGWLRRWVLAAPGIWQLSWASCRLRSAAWLHLGRVGLAFPSHSSVFGA